MFYVFASFENYHKGIESMKMSVEIVRRHARPGDTEFGVVNKLRMLNIVNLIQQEIEKRWSFVCYGTSTDYITVLYRTVLTVKK